MAELLKTLADVAWHLQFAALHINMLLTCQPSACRRCACRLSACFSLTAHIHVQDFDLRGSACAHSDAFQLLPLHLQAALQLLCSCVALLADEALGCCLPAILQSTNCSHSACKSCLGTQSAWAQALATLLARCAKLDQGLQSSGTGGSLCMGPQGAICRSIVLYSNACCPASLVSPESARTPQFYTAKDRDAADCTHGF